MNMKREERRRGECENVLKPFHAPRLQPSLTHHSKFLLIAGKDFRVVAASKRTFSMDVGTEVKEENCLGRGRVAQLMKTFSVSGESPPSQATARANKPPIPDKPGHLRPRPLPALR